MRSLVVADEYPWPTRSGYRQRLHWTLRLLTAHGPVDLLVARESLRPDRPAPPRSLGLGRVETVVSGQVTMPTSERARAWLTGRLPRVLVGRDWSAARHVAQGWQEPPHDLVWFAHAPLHLALKDVLPRPHVVDLDNLESSLLRHRRRGRPWRREEGISAVRRFGGSVADRMDEARWRDLEAEIARTAAATVVCSGLDRRRLGGIQGVAVVPNGYELPASAAGASSGRGRRPGVEPVLLLVGLLTYEPNRDAAAFFARQVLPLLRRYIPGVRFRVVGRYDTEADIRLLRGLPGVEVVGEVQDISAELTRADLAVVPIRFGGGTRIKVLEAFAHRVAVVSTTVGCEGLGVVDGEHLVLADRPEAIAAAAQRLLVDDDLRQRMADGGHALWSARYRWSSLAPAVDDLVARVTRGG